ncbi:hypothetical protein PGB28_14455 [Primorskyibacter aestuariivivens]|uniref:hypothetical protein n=1 Tax=Primorskyibacter aestuariivivens TaxID=1888912 RepID=UPI00230177CA|nr:hypothetical protein [Primorskyibacter aestuariivivens]MDA7429667.1 hypothetical protein [Primorskyibacter aestuariivivens]
MKNAILAAMFLPAMAQANEPLISLDYFTASIGVEAVTTTWVPNFFGLPSSDSAETYEHHLFDLDGALLIGDHFRLSGNFNFVHTDRERLAVGTIRRGSLEGEVLLPHGFSVGAYAESLCFFDCGESTTHVYGAGLSLGYSSDLVNVKGRFGTSNRDARVLVGFEEDEVCGVGFNDDCFSVPGEPIFETMGETGRSASVSAVFSPTPRTNIAVSGQIHRIDLYEVEQKTEIAGLGGSYSFDNGVTVSGAYEFHHVSYDNRPFLTTQEYALGVGYDFRSRGANLIVNAEFGQKHYDFHDVRNDLDPTNIVRVGITIPLGNKPKTGAVSLLHDIRDPELNGYGRSFLQ